MIRARGLRKAYANVQAVDGVSLELVAGETFGLLGPNGAGKSTTIHMLIGSLRPDAGDVTINGATDPTRAEVRRQLGVAPHQGFDQALVLGLRSLEIARLGLRAPR